jgi:hypothetical protein
MFWTDLKRHRDGRSELLAAVQGQAQCGANRFGVLRRPNFLGSLTLYFFRRCLGKKA